MNFGGQMKYEEIEWEEQIDMSPCYRRYKCTLAHKEEMDLDNTSPVSFVFNEDTWGFEEQANNAHTFFKPVMIHEHKTEPKESCLADETKETHPIDSKIDYAPNHQEQVKMEINQSAKSSYVQDSYEGEENNSEHNRSKGFETRQDVLNKTLMRSLKKYLTKK